MDILSSRRHARENKILERRKPGKLVKWTAAEVSVRQIEIADHRMLDALRVWRRFAGLPVFMVQWSRIKIAGEVRAAHAPVKVV